MLAIVYELLCGRRVAGTGSEAAESLTDVPGCNVAALQRAFGLPERPRPPLLGLVARLAGQKGIELLAGAGDAILDLGAQLVVVGEGEPRYQRMLTDLAGRHPGQVGLYLGFDEPPPPPGDEPPPPPEAACGGPRATRR